MKRALVVILIAVMIAAVIGVNDSSLAREQQTPATEEAHRIAIASRVQNIEVNRVVRIEKIDGSKIDAVLQEATRDAIAVMVLDGTDRRRETIPLSQIQKISELRGHKLRNVLIAAGIGFGVLVGTCAATAHVSLSPTVDAH